MIDYTHKVHPRSRSIRLRIESNGEIVVTSPKLTPRFMIERFIKSQSAWIESNRRKILLKQNFGLPENQILIFGKVYEKVFSKAVSSLVKVDNTKLQIEANDRKKAQRAIDRYLKQTAERYIRPRTVQLAKKMDINFSRITLREQKTRWGSCSSQGNLNFNWRLVHCPPEVIDYVIIHELAHRKEMNHSQRFWRLVAQFNPSYKTHRNWLKRRGLSVG